MGVGNKNIGELIDQLLDGQIVIPSIQRSYVWRENQIPPLLESIYRDYPIGSILIWQTSKAIPLKLAALIQQKSQPHIPMVLLDGQQRLTSLAWVWKPESRINGKRIDTRFDVTKETFKNPNSVEAKNPLLVPVRELFGKDPNTILILEKAGIRADHSLFGVYFQRLTKLNNALNNYQMPVMTFSSDDYEEVSDVFARVNQGGRRLSKGDLINSAIAARWPEGLEQIEMFTKKLKSRNFDLGSETPLRLMSLMAGKGGKYVKLLDRDMQADGLAEAWNLTEEALELGIDFLTTECRISSSSLLTSLNLVIVPGFLLHQLTQAKKAPTSEQLKKLTQWVYSVMAFGSYSSSVDSSLDTEIRFINEKPTDEALDLLRKRAFGNFPLEGSISPRDLEGKNAASGLFNLLFIHALKSGAQDWSAPLKIQLTPMNSGLKIEYHHFFPKAQMKNRAAKELWNSLANLTFVTAKTNKLISDRLPENYVEDMGITVELFQQQLLPVEKDLLKVVNFEDFLNARRQLQAQALNEILGLQEYVAGGNNADESEQLDENNAEILDLGFNLDDDLE